VEVDRGHRRETELGRGDGEDARPAPDVEEARRLHVLQELEAEPRRRMRSGAEGATGIDHDCDRVRARLLPRGTDPAATDPHAVVESAPAVLPPFGDVVRSDDVE